MGREFRVNQYGAEWQRNPDVVARAGGGFTIVWDSFLTDHDSYVISGRSFTNTGRATGGEKLLFGLDGMASTRPQATELTTGGLGIALEHAVDGILGEQDMVALTFSPGGTRRGAWSIDRLDLFEMETPVTTAIRGGGQMVVFAGDRNRTEPSHQDIFARRIDRDGAPVGREILLNPRRTAYDQDDPDAVTLENGTVVAAWVSQFSPGGGLSDQARASILRADGRFVRKDIVLDETDGDIALAPLAGGGFALAHYETRLGRNGGPSAFGYEIQLFDDRGTADGPRRAIHFSKHGVPDNIDLVQLRSGDILAVWDRPGGAAGTDVLGRLLDGKGRAASDVFHVAQKRAGTQEHPEADALGGGFVVTWTSEAADGDDDGIAARIFTRKDVAALKADAAAHAGDRLDLDMPSDPGLL